MTRTMLTICGPNDAWRVPLNPQGTVIGRHPDCGVMIDSPTVSRRHAEILPTPANQWIIRDLGSSNGTFVNGQRIESCTITADDFIQIGPVSLQLGERLEPRVASASAVQRPNILLEDFGTEVFHDRPRIEECTAQPYPQRLAKVKERLRESTDPEGVYPEVCRALAQGAGTAAAVFRASRQGDPMPKYPEVLAYHFGSSGEDTLAHDNGTMGPSHRGLRVSRRLLETVRADGRPLMSKSIFSCDTKVTVSLIDEYSPRALMCVPIGARPDVLDLLYADISIDERLAHGPEEMFAFVQAVARQATAVVATANAGE
jgi:pSer/pThr/pTyr-binding forkhead associated (FHA) protein